MAVSAFQLHNSNRDGVPSDMKCKRPKHGLTPFRVAWPTACRFTQRPCGQYNSAGRICQISRPSCHCEGAPRPWQSVLFCASGGVLSLGFCRGGALSRPFFTIPPSTRSADTSATLRRTTQCAPQGYLLRGEHWAAFTQGRLYAAALPRHISPSAALRATHPFAVY